ncbi:MAG: hypothetical protein PHS46_05790 [Candidatus Omnitrophica bacterium]|nr:hypothetical protein [Candidatus Omnitrophota bacterium]
MTPKKIKTVDVEKSDYKVFLNKAKDFYDIMMTARKMDNWTATGLNACHCAISCCDAMLTFHSGIRSVSDNHMEATELIQRLPSKIEAGESSTYRRIVAKKNLIAYENRDFRQPEAIDIAKLAERFYEWAISNLPPL